MGLTVVFRLSTDTLGYWFHVPYNAAFVEDLKSTVPGKRRSYDRQSREWYVDLRYRETVERLITRHFPGKVQFVTEGMWSNSANEANYYTYGQNAQSNQSNQSGQSRQENVGHDFWEWLRNWGVSPSQVLGVAEDASWEEVKTAYRKLARQHHPDMGGNVAKMQEINTAFDKLKKQRGM